MALLFSASTDKLVHSGYVGPSSATFTAWVKDPSLANGSPRIYEAVYPYGSAFTSRLMFNSFGDLIYQRLFSNTGVWRVSYADLGSPDLSQCHHFAVTHN